VIAVPVAERFAIAEHLIQCHAKFAGNVLEAVPVALVGFLDGTAEAGPGAGTEKFRVLLGLPVVVTGLEYCGHVCRHLLMMSGHVLKSPRQVDFSLCRVAVITVSRVL
jgi:hypothetical protein